MSAPRLILDFGVDEVRSKTDGWVLPLVRKNGHVYFKWTVSVLYTMTESRKNHCHFYHPNPGSLYAVMKREGQGEISPEVLSELERISATCDVCR